MTAIWKAEPEAESLNTRFDNWIDAMTEEVEADLAEPELHFRRTADAMSSVVEKVGPDLRDINEKAEEWAWENAGKLVTHLSQEKRDLVRRTTARAINRGYSDEEMAQIIEHSIGLTPQWLEAVDNYRDGLVAKGVPAGDARRKAGTYAKQLRHARAKSIASTELQAALNTGQRLLWEEWMADGLLPAGVRRAYVVHKDERQCARCGPLSGLTVPIGKTWKIGGVEYLSPPIHPQCRCTEVLVGSSGQIIKHQTEEISKHGVKGKPGYYLLHPGNKPTNWKPSNADKAAANKILGYTKFPVKAAPAKKVGAKKPAKYTGKKQPYKVDLAANLTAAELADFDSPIDTPPWKAVAPSKKATKKAAKYAPAYKKAVAASKKKAGLKYVKPGNPYVKIALNNQTYADWVKNISNMPQGIYQSLFYEGGQTDPGKFGTFQKLPLNVKMLLVANHDSTLTEDDVMSNIPPSLSAKVYDLIDEYDEDEDDEPDEAYIAGAIAANKAKAAKKAVPAKKATKKKGAMSQAQAEAIADKYFGIDSDSADLNASYTSGMSSDLETKINDIFESSEYVELAEGSATDYPKPIWDAILGDTKNPLNLITFNNLPKDTKMLFFALVQGDLTTDEFTQTASMKELQQLKMFMPKTADPEDALGDEQVKLGYAGAAEMPPQFLDQKYQDRIKDVPAYLQLNAKSRRLFLGMVDGVVDQDFVEGVLDPEDEALFRRVTDGPPEVPAGVLFGGFDDTPGPSVSWGAGADFHLPPGGDWKAFDNISEAGLKLQAKKYSVGTGSKLESHQLAMSSAADKKNYYAAIGGKDAPVYYSPNIKPKYPTLERASYGTLPGDAEILAQAATWKKSHKNVTLDLYQDEASGEWHLDITGEEKTVEDFDSYEYADLPEKYQMAMSGTGAYESATIDTKKFILNAIDGKHDQSDASSYLEDDEIELAYEAMGWEEEDDYQSDDDDSDYDSDDDDEREIPSYSFHGRPKTGIKVSKKATNFPIPKLTPIQPREGFEHPPITPAQRLTDFPTNMPVETPSAEHLEMEGDYFGDDMKEAGQGAQGNAKRKINHDLTRRLVERLETDPDLRAWAEENVDWYINYEVKNVYDTKTGNYVDKYYKRSESDTYKLDSDYNKASGGNPDVVSNEEKLLAIYANHAIGGWAGTSGDSQPGAIAMQRAVAQRFGLSETEIDVEHMKTGHTPQGWPNSDKVLAKHSRFMSAFIDAMYDNTQARFEEQGIHEVIIYRGLDVEDEDHPLAPKLKPTTGITPEERKKLVEEQAKLTAKVAALYKKYSNGDMTYDEYMKKRNPLQKRQKEVNSKLNTGEYEPYAQTRVRMQPASSFSATPHEATNFGKIILSVKVPRKRILGTARTGFGCLNEYEFVVLGGPTEATINHQPYIHRPGSYY